MPPAQHSPPPQEPDTPPRKRKPLPARLRGWLAGGALLMVPLTLTAYVTWSVLTYVDRKVLSLLPTTYGDALTLALPGGGELALPGFGLVVVLTLLTLIGWLTANVAGRLFVRLSEAVIRRMPVVRGLYGAVKQILVTVVQSDTPAFRQVGMVRFPSPGSWSVAFVTGPPPPQVLRALNLEGEDMLGVFMPTAPNPTSGYLMYMPRERVYILDMSVEDGLKLVISGGLAIPEERSLPLPAEAAPAPPLQPASG